MTLTLGAGPFGRTPGGRFNFDPPRGVLYFEGSPRRVRARFAGETVVDSKRVKLLHESGFLPVYYFPESDVRSDLLERTDRVTGAPLKGRAVYWSVRAGGRVAPNAAWSYPEPPPGAPPLAGHLAFYWEAMDEWLEEDERVFGHPRDPYHRVDVVDTSRHVKVSVGGELVAETRRARALFETGLPPRWYLPPEDVRRDALEPSDARTVCAYKGHASYWSVRVGGTFERDLIWYYPEPRHEALRVKGYLCFYDERVDVELDGDPQPRPRTPWSDDGAEEARRREEAAWPGA